MTGVQWNATPGSQENDLGQATISTSALVSAHVTISNPDGYELNLLEGTTHVGVQNEALKSVRIHGGAGEWVRKRASITDSSKTGFSLEIKPIANMPNTLSQSLEHTDFMVDFVPVRTDSGVETPHPKTLALRYNTPPRFPMEIVVVPDGAGGYKYDWLGSVPQMTANQNDPSWNRVEGTGKAELDGHLFWAWPQDNKGVTDPEYAAGFQISKDGGDYQVVSLAKTMVGETIKDSAGRLYNIYKVPVEANVELAVRAVDGESVYGSSSVSGRSPYKVTVNPNGGTFNDSASSITIWKAGGTSITGLDLPIPCSSNGDAVLIGWAESSDGTLVSFPYTIDSEKTLYAIYEKLSDDVVPPVRPDEPDNPGEPDNPDNPNEPDVPDEPGTGGITATAPTYTDIPGLGSYTLEGSRIVFTAPSSYTSYQWYLDGGTVAVATTAQYVVDVNTLTVGSHRVTIVVADASGRQLSGGYQLSVYGIGYNLAGGKWADDTALPATRYVSGMETKLPSSGDVKRDNYTFDGWYNNAACTGQAVAMLPANAIGAKTLYAKWTGVSATIQLEDGAGNGGAGSVSAIYGQVLPTLEKLPAQAGYVFGGYFDGDVQYYDATGKGIWIWTDTTVTSLQAKWTRQFTGGISAAPPVNRDLGDIGTVEIAGDNISFTAEAGYASYRWWLDGVQVGSGKDYVVLLSSLSVGTHQMRLEATDNHGKVYSAQHDLTIYSIDYQLNGGQWMNQSQQVKRYLPGVAVPLPDASSVARRGVAFGGWYDNAQFTGTALTEIPADAIGSKELYARWLYTLNFDLNGGTASWNTNQQVAAGGRATAPVFDPENSDATSFVGWYMDKGTFAHEFDFANTVVTSHLTLYAKWRYTISFDLDGGTSDGNSTVDSQVIESGQQVVAPANPTKAGFTFIGWYSDKSPGEFYDFSTIPDGNMTLTAMYREDASKAVVSFMDKAPESYPDITAALNAAKASKGSVLKLYDNVSATLTINSGNFTLDLNGKKISGVIVVDGAGTSLIIDDSAGGGSITGARHNNTSIGEVNAGIRITGTSCIVTINGGAISVSESSYYEAYGIDNCKNSTVIVNGGSIKASNYYSSGGEETAGIRNCSTGTVIVTGGIVSGSSTAGYAYGIENRDKGTVTITGGEVRGNSQGASGYGVHSWHGTIDVQGGSITGITSASDTSYCGNGICIGSVGGNSGPYCRILLSGTPGITGTGTVDGQPNASIRVHSDITFATADTMSGGIVIQDGFSLPTDSSYSIVLADFSNGTIKSSGIFAVPADDEVVLDPAWFTPSSRYTSGVSIIKDGNNLKMGTN